MSKEQKETIAFIIIVLAIVVAACFMLIIKPKMGDVADTKKSIKNVNTEIEKQRKYSKQLVELSGKKEKFENGIVSNESGLFGGITVGDLSGVVNTISNSGFRNLKFNSMGDRAEILAGKRYNELVNDIKIQNCDYLDVVRFIYALETSNPGLRITNIEMEGVTVKPEGDSTTTKPKGGVVDAGMEVKLLGFHEGEGIPSGWEPPKTPGYDPGRNPFIVGGSRPPDTAIKTMVSNIKITMNTADSIWVKNIAVANSGARECMVKKLMPVFEPAKVRLVSIHEDYFVVQWDDGKTYKLMIRQANETIGKELYERGTISQVIEIEK